MRKLDKKTKEILVEVARAQERIEKKQRIGIMILSLLSLLDNEALDDNSIGFIEGLFEVDLNEHNMPKIELD